MAQWKETLEPYIKINERIRTTTIVPTAGEDLIIGATIISDSGPSYPVLITSQREFLNVFASQEITKGYIESLNDFYDDGTNTKTDVASTMWLNAYRLAGSTNMLIVRATKGADMNYIVSLGDDNSKYIVRDGQLLKQVDSFSLVIDRIGTNADNTTTTGWAISINEIGIIGNLVGDEGPVYEYFAADLKELVEYLNSTSKFFCPNPEYFTIGENNSWMEAGENDKPSRVLFGEVYLAQNFLDKTGFERFSGIESEEEGHSTASDGLAYLVATTAENPGSIDSTNLVDLNTDNFSGGDYPDEGYLVNTFNSNSDIKVRIRRFNHDAVILRDNIKPTVVAGGDSPFEVITEVVDQFTKTIEEGSSEAAKRIKDRDFYEVAVLDPSLDKDPLSFCVGNIPGRGDITLDELNDTLKMINIHISSMEDLNLPYFGATVKEEEGDNSGDQENVNTPGGFPAALDGYKWVSVTDPDNSNVEEVPENTESLVGGKVYTAQITNHYYGVSGLDLTYLNNESVIEFTIPSNKFVNELQVRFGEDNNTYYTINLSTGSLSIDNNSTDNLQIPVAKVTITELNSILHIPSSDDRNNWGNISGMYYKVIANSEGGNIPIKLQLLPDTESINIGNEELSDPESPYVIAQTIDSDEVKEKLSDPETLRNLYNAYNNNTTTIVCNNVEFGDLYKLVAITPDSTTTTNTAEIYKDLGIDTNATSLLSVTPNDLMRSISAITEDEVYTTEGLTDLGNTDLKFQTYLCNMAKNENYFYPISTLYSTNYLAIANYRSRLAQDSHKLYTSAPWDIDSGTVGFKFHACPSVIYWEAVSRNRSMNREFASVFGFSSNGQVLYTNPVTEFTKKQRQLLLSKQVNTVMWNTQNQTWNMNDCYTMTSENHILNEDGNSRLFIRINKAIPTLLRPLIGRKLNNATYADAETILKYWFERTILTMQYSVSDYKVTIANLEANDDQARRQNKMYVLVECLFARSMKYVIVYSDALDMGMEFVGEIV